MSYLDYVAPFLEYLFYWIGLIVTFFGFAYAVKYDEKAKVKRRCFIVLSNDLELEGLEDIDDIEPLTFQETYPKLYSVLYYLMVLGMIVFLVLLIVNYLGI